MTELLITGATGFVGSHVVETLASRGERARALVRESSDTSLLERHGFETVVGSLSDEASLRRAVDGADAVLHLAAATRALDEATFHRVNAQGTANLVAAMEATGGRGRLVYLSSMAAVGPARDRPVRPDDEPRPLTAYGRSKLAGERAVRDTTREAAVIRAPAVYGPGDRDLLIFFRLARLGVLPAVGPTDRRVQMIHAADLAGALLAGVGARASGVYHVAEPRAYAWAEVLERVGEAVGRGGVRIPVPAAIVKVAAAISEGVSRVTGRPVIFDRDKAKELLAEWVCETDRARDELGFEASIPLDRGLRDTVAWY
ncbi:MAG: NAD-dependent epimerase/dehydratase family protein, partial [Longimicrobiales bacterium]|nr:NAD-dependent epimerase/dehydratase family protein [Longimicrobiales bacterium]